MYTQSPKQTETKGPVTLLRIVLAYMPAYEKYHSYAGIR